MTIEEILDKLEAEFNRYFYYRHITKDLRGEENALNIHSFVFITPKQTVGGTSLPDGYTEEDVKTLILDIGLFLKENGWQEK